MRILLTVKQKLSMRAATIQISCSFFLPSIDCCPCRLTNGDGNFFHLISFKFKLNPHLEVINHCTMGDSEFLGSVNSVLIFWAKFASGILFTLSIFCLFKPVVELVTTTEHQHSDYGALSGKSKLNNEQRWSY